MNDNESHLCMAWHTASMDATFGMPLKALLNDECLTHHIIHHAKPVMWLTFQESGKEKLASYIK
jgi:hypothetical protein